MYKININGAVKEKIEEKKRNSFASLNTPSDITLHTEAVHCYNCYEAYNTNNIKNMNVQTYIWKCTCNLCHVCNSSVGSFLPLQIYDKNKSPI